MPGALRRWLKRIGIGLLAILVIALATGGAYEAYARQAARRDHPPRGVLVDVGNGRRLHVDCRGRGRPVVVLEAGLDLSGSLAWSAVHDRISATTRACAYDRAGIMWSDRRDGATDAEAVATDLHAALSSVGERGPFVIAAHSLGGPLAMTYVRRFPGEVAGLVFIDASHPDQVRHFDAARIPTSGQTAALQALVALRWTGIGRLPLLGPGPPGMPADAQATARAFGLESAPAALAEYVALPTILEQAGRLRTLGDRPTHVLTARRPLTDDELRSVGLTRSQADRMREIWAELQTDEAAWSSDSRHDLVEDASHYVQFDRPDLVVAAVRGVVDRVRQKAPPDTAVIETPARVP